jgi:putative heme-binding domain-containing protein
MPPGNYSDAQAVAIVEYLRSLVSTPPALVPGDPARGKAIFEGKGACLGCHRVAGRGARTGPDLSDIGQIRRAADLERSLLDPGAEVLPANRMYRVVTRDGTPTSGRLLNHDSFAVLLIDAREQLRSFDKASLREHAFVDESAMPSYRDKLTGEELTDVIRYLVSLRGVTATR